MTQMCRQPTKTVQKSFPLEPEERIQTRAYVGIRELEYVSNSWSCLTVQIAKSIGINFTFDKHVVKEGIELPDNGNIWMLNSIVE